jgi:hypothetical protein
MICRSPHDWVIRRAGGAHPDILTLCTQLPTVRRTQLPTVRRTQPPTVQRTQPLVPTGCVDV